MQGSIFSSEYGRSVLLLCSGFFLVFFAFNSVQLLLSTVLKDKQLAFTTLSTIYAVFATTNVVAPKIVAVIGPRLGMFFGSICYILLVVANIFPPLYYTFVPASALVGVGAGVLWTSQNIYMSRCAAREALATGEKVDDVTSRFNGIFWAGFQLNGAAGLLIAAVLQTAGINYQYIFTGFAIGGCVGVGLLFLLKDAPPLTSGPAASLNSAASEVTLGLLDKGSDEEDSSASGGEAAGGGSGGGGEVTLLDTLNLAATSRRMQCFIPALLFNGMSLGFAQGAFTTMFAHTDSYGGLLSATQYVGYYGATFYLANSVFSYAWGRAMPALGRRRAFQLTGAVMALWLLGVTLVCSGALAPAWPGSAYTAPTAALDSPAAYATVFLAAIVFALADSVLESQVPAIVQSPAFFPNERERDAAGSNVKLWQSLGFTLQFVLGVAFAGQGIARSVLWQAYILAPLAVAAYAGLLYCDARVAPFDAAKQAAS